MLIQSAAAETAASFIFMLGLFWVLFRRVEGEIVFFLLAPHFRLGRRLWGSILPGEAGSIRCWKDLAVSLPLSLGTHGGIEVDLIISVADEALASSPLLFFR